MKLAVIQMVSTCSVAGNLQAASVLLSRAADAGAELAVLPEYFCLLGRRDIDKLAIQEGWGSGPIQDFMARTARELGLWIVAGTMPLSLPPGDGQAPQSQGAAGERVHNSSLVFDPRGDCVARYDKIHLFRFDNGHERYDESRVLLAGQQPVTLVT